MLGEPDQIYRQARRTLLDALEALGEHRKSLVVVGAQAIYLHTGEGELSLQPYTTDADLAVDPRELASHPKIESLLQNAGFVRSPNPAKIGTWIGAHDVPIDLLAPEALSGRGRRSADLGAQGSRLARRAYGLEAALVDNVQMVVAALEPEDTRRYEVTVAGPAALLVAKLHKIADRQEQPRRQEDKDALDVYRLLSAVPTEELAAGVQRTLSHDLSRAVTQKAIDLARQLFGTPRSPGAQMAARSLELVEDPVFIASSAAALADDFLAALARYPNP